MTKSEFLRDCVKCFGLKSGPVVPSLEAFTGVCAGLVHTGRTRCSGKRRDWNSRINPKERGFVLIKFPPRKESNTNVGLKEVRVF